MHSTISSDMSGVPRNIREAGKDASEMYARLRSEGLSHTWCEMVVLQKPPGTKGSDRSFMEGRLNNQQLDDMPKDHAQQMVKVARKAGINPSGKYYSSGLADHRGPADPAAWIDSTADVRKVAMDRNLSVSGAVTHKGIQEAPKRKPLSDRLTKEMMRVEQARHPTMKKGELREMVIAKYARKVK